MRLTSIFARRLAAATLALSTTSTLVVAQSWPAKPVTIVQGFPAGSGVDIVARVVQGPLEKALGTTIVFDYKTGAGGNVASEHVAKASADGYTLLLGTAGTHGINAALYKKLKFDVEADFTAIAPLVDVPNVLTINPKAVDAKDAKDFIAKVKAQPGKLNFASTGNGTSTHLGFAQFNAAAGLDMVHVPYKGSPEAIQRMLNGEVCCLFAQLQTVMGQHKAGTLRLLGVSTPARVPILPEVPTLAEAALPGFASVTWYGLFGPKGLDPTIVAKLNAAIKAALEDKAVATRMASLGNAIRYETVDAFRATVKKDRAQWAEVVKKSGASID